VILTNNLSLINVDASKIIIKLMESVHNALYIALIVLLDIVNVTQDIHLLIMYVHQFVINIKC
jgi:hypothetical protein